MGRTERLAAGLCFASILTACGGGGASPPGNAPGASVPTSPSPSNPTSTPDPSGPAGSSTGETTAPAAVTGNDAAPAAPTTAPGPANVTTGYSPPPGSRPLLGACEAPRAGLLQGVVVGFGPIDDGVVVTAYAVANGVRGAALGTGAATGATVCASFTAPAGAYSIDIGSYSGPIVLQAAGGTYTSLATGQVTPLGVVLTAVAPTEGGVHVVSPLTTAAFDREFLLESGAAAANLLTADNINTANAAIAQVCGCKPLDEAPAFINNISGTSGSAQPSTAAAQGDWLAILSQYVTGTPLRVSSPDQASPQAAGLATFAFHPDDPTIALAASDWGVNILNGTYVNNLLAARNMASWLDAPDPLAATVTAADAGPVSMGGYTLQVNLGPMNAPFRKFTLDKIRETFFATYPVMAARFNPSAPSTVTLNFLDDPNASYAAATSNATINFSAAYLLRAPLDIDVVTHEAFHVVQSYPSENGAGWVVEGLADYARYVYGAWNAVSGWTMGRPGPSDSYAAGYGTTARFFHWLEERHKAPGGTLLEDLDAAMRAGTYTAAFWPAHTGETIDQLWSDYLADASFNPP